MIIALIIFGSFSIRYKVKELKLSLEVKEVKKRKAEEAQKAEKRRLAL